jgi:hypothetical protein
MGCFPCTKKVKKKEAPIIDIDISDNDTNIICCMIKYKKKTKVNNSRNSSTKSSNSSTNNEKENAPTLKDKIKKECNI